MFIKLAWLIKKFFGLILSIPLFLAIALVYFYKLVISPWTPSVCRFKPSCSAYAIIALKRFGLAYGGWLTIKRLFRCNPKSCGGDDPVPYNLKGDFKWLI